MLKVAFSVETSGHYSEENGEKENKLLHSIYGSFNGYLGMGVSTTGFLSLSSTENHVFPCFNITWKNRGCLLSNFLALNLSLRGITNVVHERYSISIYGHA